MARKSRVWTYIGDMKCPCCGKYNKVLSNGKGDKQVMKITCKTTGIIWLKSISLYCHWFIVDDVETEMNKIKEERSLCIR